MCYPFCNSLSAPCCSMKIISTIGYVAWLWPLLIPNASGLSTNFPKIHHRYACSTLPLLLLFHLLRCSNLSSKNREPSMSECSIASKFPKTRMFSTNSSPSPIVTPSQLFCQYPPYHLSNPIHHTVYPRRPWNFKSYDSQRLGLIL